MYQFCKKNWYRPIFNRTKKWPVFTINSTLHRPWTGLARKRRASGQRQAASGMLFSLFLSPKISKKWKRVHLGFMGAGTNGKCTFSDGTPTHICIHFIFIANKCIALHFPSPILHRFGFTARFMCSWPHLYSTLILGEFPLHQIVHVGVSQSRGLKLFGREIIFEEFQPIWTRYLIVTDGQTDRQTTYCRITAICASIAR